MVLFIILFVGVAFGVAGGFCIGYFAAKRLAEIDQTKTAAAKLKQAESMDGKW